MNDVGLLLLTRENKAARKFTSPTGTGREIRTV